MPPERQHKIKRDANEERRGKIRNQVQDSVGNIRKQSLYKFKYKMQHEARSQGRQARNIECRDFVCIDVHNHKWMKLKFDYIMPELVLQQFKHLDISSAQ